MTMEATRRETHATARNSFLVDYYKHKGYTLRETDIIPHHWGRQSATFVVVHVEFPLGTFECLAEGYANTPGYGAPYFDSLDDAVRFIDDHLPAIRV